MNEYNKVSFYDWGQSMLALKSITKDYPVGDTKVTALNGIDLAFRDHEFVSILGPSGCGKTTMLNIVGGLDRYTSGDLIINGRSTKEYKDKDWDNYRNHSIGFVFQSYNLIPHQTVLANVELALTLSGVSKAERRERAIHALEQVGLGEHIHKKPNQLSGGQMQRVAIARALVNDPDILLADEPTGALDTKTSVQIMEILKEISQDKLIIMVTHNPDLAQQYSSRIVRLLDGDVVGDTNPYTEEEIHADLSKGKDISTKRKKNMSFGTAISLSFHNLLTKKARTLMTSFAGSIGIIGIALILALSTGVQAYIDTVQKDTLSSYPVTINKEDNDMISAMTSMQDSMVEENKQPKQDNIVYSTSIMYELFHSMNSSNATENNLTDFKAFLDEQMNEETSTTDLYQYTSAIQYQYDVDMNTYITDADGNYRTTDIADVFSESENPDLPKEKQAMYEMMKTQLSSYELWQEIPSGTDGSLISDMVSSQYDLVYGQWPSVANEVVLVLNGNSEISDIAFYSLGLLAPEQVQELLDSSTDGTEVDKWDLSLNYQEICEKSFKLLLNPDYYANTGKNGTWEYIGDDQTRMDMTIKNGYDLNIVGIIQPNEDASATTLSGTFGYTSALTEYMVDKIQTSDIVAQQTAVENENYDVFSGLPFTKEERELTNAEKAEEIKSYFSGLNNQEKTDLYTRIFSEPPEEYVQQVLQSSMAKYSTREEMESAIASQYQMDNATVQSYLSSYSDEELQTMIQQQITAMIQQNYAAQAKAAVKEMMGTDGEIDQSAGYAKVAAIFDAQIGSVQDEATLAGYYDKYMPSGVSESTLEENMKTLGVVDLDSPSAINIYANSFENKDAISDIITDYNNSVAEEDAISYTDYVALLMSGITTIINAISYGLIAFVAISLVVSSIMIGIITYISVLERTKEIGILRSIGASKKDVSHVFNAEAMIIGFCAGALGVIISLLLCLPINWIIHALTNIPTINAYLSPVACIILVAISMGLTFIAGLIPSRIAAKKNPVESLRSE